MGILRRIKRRVLRMAGLAPDAQPAAPWKPAAPAAAPSPGARSDGYGARHEERMAGRGDASSCGHHDHEHEHHHGHDHGHDDHDHGHDHGGAAGAAGRGRLQMAGAGGSGASTAGKSAEQWKSEIESDVRSHKIVIYMKGTAQAPQCGFSAAAIEPFEALGVPFETRNVLADPGLRQAVKDYTDWPTIPQVFIGGEFVGGTDIVRELHGKGELKPMVEKALQA